LAPRLQRDDGRVRWEEGAQAISNRHRGVAGWPGSWCTLPDGGVLKIHALDLPGTPSGGTPGEISALDPSGLSVACGTGTIRLLQVQAPNRGRLPAHAWALGARIGVGDRLA
jgi:methionyl-tRNA formyltransferase